MTPEVGTVPFREAIQFLEQKLQIPTQFSGQLRGAANAKAFTIAGALKGDLLRDLHESVTDALRNGESIGEFRKRFDEIVQSHGWSYKGKRGWRTRVIYDTNLRTARAAGKWQQFERLKERRPYLIYQTAGDQRVRPEHAAWNNTVLPVDHPFWETHYPPNGWGCRCTIRSASERDLNRLGLSISEPPNLESERRINTRTGEDSGNVPKGIDTGWDYNVGKAWLGPELAFGEKAMQLPDGIRTQLLGNTRLLSQLIQQPFTRWARQAIQTGTSNQIRTAGYLSNSTLSGLAGLGVSPQTAAISVSSETLQVMRQALRKRSGNDLSLEALLSIPTQLTRPRAVIWDKAERQLLYLFDINESSRAGTITATARLKQPNDPSNMIESARRIERSELSDTGRYEVLEGEL